MKVVFPAPSDCHRPLPAGDGSERAAKALWVSRGINNVPAVVEGKWLISSG